MTTRNLHTTRVDLPEDPEMRRRFRIVNQNIEALRTQLERLTLNNGLIQEELIDHGGIAGLADDDHTQYSRADGTRDFTAPVGGQEPVDLDHLTTKSYVDDGDSALEATLDQYTALLNAAVLETIDVHIENNGGVTELHLQASGGGDLTFIFGSEQYTLDCTPNATVALTSGTDTVPVENFVYVTESGGVLTLEASTVGWPATAYAPISTVVLQSNATFQTDGALKHHAWTDHISKSTENGHLQHINRWIRQRPAAWISGCAAGNLSVSAPDAYISVASGVVQQLHEHTMPAWDLNGDHCYVVNDPTTAYKRITTLDDITQDASGGAINNKWMNLVVWGVVSENDADCHYFVNLPSGTYNTAAQAALDASAHAVYSIPSEYVGCAFLVARYNVQAKDSGTWVQDSITDLRGQFPSTGAGTGGGLGAVSPLTTKGDVWVYSTEDARLGVGTDAQVLTADSSEATGLKWAAAASGGSPPTDFDLLTDGVSELVFAGGDVVWIT
jgi:hypothetical protein